jgi:hypothetical protein
VKEIKKNILVFALALMAVAMLVSPVLALGPEEAVGKNPNMMPPAPWGIDMALENGVHHGWITVTPIPKTELSLNAQTFKIKNAIVITEPFQINNPELENKWLFITQSIWYDYLIMMGTPPPLAEYIASMSPEGLYYKWNYVGQ